MDISLYKWGNRMSLSGNNAKKVLASLKIGDRVEYDYIKKNQSGKVAKIQNGQPYINTDGIGLGHLMTIMSLNVSGYTTFLKVNGKLIVEDGKLK